MTCNQVTIGYFKMLLQRRLFLTSNSVQLLVLAKICDQPAPPPIGLANDVFHSSLSSPKMQRSQRVSEATSKAWNETVSPITYGVSKLIQFKFVIPSFHASAVSLGGTCSNLRLNNPFLVRRRCSAPQGVRIAYKRWIPMNHTGEGPRQ